MSAARRCFIALDISPQARTALASVIDDMHSLRRANPRAAQVLTPVPAANLHLTLKFLGDIDDDAVDRLSVALDTLSEGQPPILDAHIDGLGRFGSARRPRLIYAPVLAGSGCDAVVNLARSVSTLCAQLGIGEYERPRPFTPHITLARVDATAGDPRPVGQWMTAAASRSWGPVDGSSIVLYESSRNARQYVPLLRAPLRG